MAALRVAAEEAKTRSAKLRIVVAWHIPLAVYTDGLPPPTEITSDMQEAAKDIAQLAEAAVPAGIDFETKLCEGQPADVLIEESKGAEVPRRRLTRARRPRPVRARVGQPARIRSRHVSGRGRAAQARGLTSRSLRPERAQRVQDHGDVDRLLENGAGDRRDGSPTAAKPIATTLSPIPTSTLCRAMRSERRPIRTASATRSTRSTTITASAVSEAIVAPAAPIAMPTSASASAGRVVDAVADHHHRAELRARLHRPHDLELLLGRLLGVDAVDAEPRADLLGDRRAIAGDHRHVDDAGSAELVGDAVRRPRADGRPSRWRRPGCRRRRRAPRARPCVAAPASDVAAP